MQETYCKWNLYNKQDKKTKMSMTEDEEEKSFFRNRSLHF